MAPMKKGDPGYTVAPRRALFAERGTEVKIGPLLDGIRSLSGEKIQWYLAAELRDRIRQSGVRISVIDKLARKQYAVEPRQYEGRLLHQLPAVRSPRGHTYVKLYLNVPAEENRVALSRNGTRVLEDIALLDDFARTPWTTRYLQGHVDAPFVNLTPGTRSGLIAVRFVAAAEPGLTRACVTVRQGDVVCEAEALITVTHELLPQLGNTAVEAQGLPGYTFERAAGESWRSKFDVARNLIVINNGHRDFVYAGRSKGLKLRYLVRLYAKELVLRNFVGLPADQLLERMVELSLRTEEHL